VQRRSKGPCKHHHSSGISRVLWGQLRCKNHFPPPNVTNSTNFLFFLFVYLQLIALDEPTTNLDQDNVRSLAKSLHDIIKARQAQSNFQLIVITHDEEFLKEMNCQEYCDTYFRISRNDRQKSIIERQSIMEVI
jgi:hypothetical protein